MSTGTAAYIGLVIVVAATRLAELLVARRNMRWKCSRGGVEHGAGHYPVLVGLHAVLLVGCVVEPVVADRPFLPWLGWPMLGLVVASHCLRLWSIHTLGSQWTARVMVVPGMPLVTTGPYRWMRHPNYLAVVVEGVALPLVHTAWAVALVFTLANLAVLRVRIRVEQAALHAHRCVSMS